MSLLMRQWILTGVRSQSSAHRTSVDPNASTSGSGGRLAPLDLGPSPDQATERRYGGTANEPVRTRSDYRGAEQPDRRARSIGARRAPHHLIPRDLINVRFAPLYGLKSDTSRGPKSATSRLMQQQL